MLCLNIITLNIKTENKNLLKKHLEKHVSYIKNVYSENLYRQATDMKFFFH